MDYLVCVQLMRSIYLLEVGILFKYKKLKRDFEPEYSFLSIQCGRLYSNRGSELVRRNVVGLPHERLVTWRPGRDIWPQLA